MELFGNMNYGPLFDGLGAFCFVVSSTAFVRGCGYVDGVLENPEFSFVS